MKSSSHVLWLALAFYIFLHEHVFTIVNGIGKLADPVAQYHHACLMAFCFCRTGQVDIKLNMTMSEDEVVDIGMILDILLGIEHQMFLVLPQIDGLVFLLMTDIAVFGPGQSAD